MEAELGKFLLDKWFDIVMAFVAYFVAEAFDLNSVPRTVVRKVKNRISWLSMTLLEMRLRRLKLERERLKKYLSSDRLIYLETLKGMTRMLSCLCLSLLCIYITDHVRGGPAQPGNGGVVALSVDVMLYQMRMIPIFLLIMGAVFGKMAMRNASRLDTREKLEKLVKELDREIMVLEGKVDSRARAAAASK